MYLNDHNKYIDDIHSRMEKIKTKTTMPEYNKNIGIIIQSLDKYINSYTPSAF